MRFSCQNNHQNFKSSKSPPHVKTVREQRSQFMAWVMTFLSTTTIHWESTINPSSEKCFRKKKLKVYIVHRKVSAKFLSGFLNNELRTTDTCFRSEREIGATDSVHYRSLIKIIAKTIIQIPTACCFLISPNKYSIISLFAKKVS